MADEATTPVAPEASAPTTPESSAPAAEASAAPAAPADLDAAIARAQAAMEASSAAQESDDDAADEAAEAPADAESDAPAAQAPESDDATAADGAEDDDAPTITRRNAREIAQKAVEQYAAEKARADELQTQIRQREAEDGQIVGQVLGWVGSNDEYAQVKARATDLNADEYSRTEAIRELNGMDAARSMYAATWRAVEGHLVNRAAQGLLSNKALPNVDGQVLDSAADLASVGQHLHEAGRLTERAEWQAKEQKWQADTAKLKASYEAKLAKAAGRMPSPERGGRSGGPSGALEGLVDPRTGLPSDEAMAQWNRGELRFDPAA